MTGPLEAQPQWHKDLATGQHRLLVEEMLAQILSNQLVIMELFSKERSTPEIKERFTEGSRHLTSELLKKVRKL